MIYGECGRYHLYIQSQVKVIKYWLRLLDMPSSRLRRKCYNMMLLYDKNGQKNWVTGVKDLLFSIGFGYIWNNQEAGIELGFLQLFIQRIKDMYLQKWFERTSLSRKCDFYSLFKRKLCPEFYLSCVNVKVYRISLARFRCSSHDLYIEKGRYSNINREQRVCQVCDLNTVEDEFHFLLVCPAYSALRYKYIQERYYVHLNNNKLSLLLNSSNYNVIQNLSIYVNSAMLHRRTLL